MLLRRLATCLIPVLLLIRALRSPRPDRLVAAVAEDDDAEEDAP